MSTVERDEVAFLLRNLVGGLELQRAAGTPFRPLAEQRAYREGFTAAMRLVASSALLVSMMDEVKE